MVAPATPAAPDRSLRLAVYTDYHYRRVGEALYAERAFALFLFALSRQIAELVIVGKVGRGAGQAHYRLPDSVGFTEIPYFERLDRPVSAVGAILRSIGRLWRALDSVDGVWLLGPHPLGLVFAAIAVLRGRTVTLGVRQDFPRYVRSRHPNRRWIHAAGDILEASWRLMGRRFGVVVVGSALADTYQRSRRCLEIAVSLVSEHDIASPSAVCRAYDGEELWLLSVGRLEQEKNPLLLADVLSQLRQSDPRWRLQVCGDGPLKDALRARLREHGVDEWAMLRGYISQSEGLREIYREAHLLLHVSWTEGVPQVLYEAFAARLPVVATAVGGVTAAAGDAAVLIDPGRPDQAVDAVRRIAASPDLRARLIESGLRRIEAHTLESEAGKVAQFLSAASRGRRAPGEELGLGSSRRCR